MKKLLCAFMMMFIVGLIAGCDDTSTTTNNYSNNDVSNNEFDEVFTLQGTLFDATTGARLTGSSLTVTLVRGTEYYTPNLLKKDTSETTFAGDYAFSNIPITLHGNTTYRIVATMSGYQQFEAYINYTANRDFDDNNTHDSTYNMVGNIYMFPLGAQASDIDIYVEYNGERVSGATVQLQLQISNNTITTQNSNRLLSATNGTLPVISATTDANGIAKFDGSLLALGGQYVPRVLPLVYEGTQLAITTGTAIVVGSSTVSNVQHITMLDTAPNNEDNGLYIVSASNRDSEDVLSSGVLTITFNKAIALVSEDAFTAVLTNANGAVLAADTVTTTVSTDGLVLTLTPNFSTNPVAFTGNNEPTADIGLSITYTGGQVTLAGDNTNEALNILVNGNDDILYLNGNDLSRVVNIYGPQNE